MIESANMLNDEAVRLAMQGYYKESVACFKRAIFIEAGNATVWYNLGVTHRDAGNFLQARSAFERAFNLNNKDLNIIEALGEVCFRLEDYTRVALYCNIGLGINPRSSHLWNTMGALHFNLGNYSDSQSDFEKAIAIDPNYIDALYNLRDVYNQVGNTVGESECQRRLNSLC